jgi:ketosteroid isomerase-like protein
MLEHRARVVLMVVFMTGALAVPSAAFQNKNNPASSKGNAAVIRDRAQKLWAAYSTLDASKARTFYAGGADKIFYDIAPLEYRGIDEYQKGAVELLKQFRTASFKLNDDFAVHLAGNQAWSTATWQMGGVGRDGNKTSMQGRWTAIWQRRNGNWLIVHEHVSVPLGTQAEKEQNLSPDKR